MRVYCCDEPGRDGARCDVGPGMHDEPGGILIHCDRSRPGFRVEWDALGWVAITGPVAEGLRALTAGLRAIGEAWEAEPTAFAYSDPWPVVDPSAGRPV